MRNNVLSILAILLSLAALVTSLRDSPYVAAYATHIEFDQSASAIRFFVDGREKARLTEAGLQVRDDIDFGGVLTDVGTAPFDAATPGPEGDEDAP